MCEVKGIDEQSLNELEHKLITSADEISVKLNNLMDIFELTSNNFKCDEADKFRSSVLDYLDTSKNISSNIDSYAVDIAKLNSQYHGLDKKQSSSITNNINNVNTMSERRIIDGS